MIVDKVLFIFMKWNKNVFLYQGLAYSSKHWKDKGTHWHVLWLDFVCVYVNEVQFIRILCAASQV